MDGEYLIVSGLQILGVNPQRFFSSASIMCAHLFGTDKQVFGGTLPEQIGKTLATHKCNIKQLGKIVGAKIPATTSGYPGHFLRELIVNAVTLRNTT